MYFELTVDKFCDFSIDEPKGLPWDFSLIEGAVIRDDMPKPFEFTTNAKTDEEIPDFWNRSFPAMSKKFVTLLEDAGVDNLQKFPALVKSTESEAVWDNYYLVNILGLIQCADLSRSDYNEIFPGNYRFRKLAIDSSKANDALLFRLQESPGTILIHKSVGKHIMLNDPDEKITGWDVNEIIQ